ncbi:MAG: hypothetical protein HYV51_01240 [Parcubacteria group bacterium]|nr:hypothetical protein [Parcubacteria group bacterium]
MIIKFLLLLFLGGLIVLVSFLFGWYSDLTSLLSWWVANSLHFLGGIYAFFFVKFVFNATHKYHKTETAFLMKIIIFTGGALVLGVLWEWYEFIFIYNYGNGVFRLLPKSITIYHDTMTDLMFDLLGAASVGVYLIVKNGKNK